MNPENRTKVEEFLSQNNAAPLIFLDYISPVNEFDPTKFSVEDMVIRALYLSGGYKSVEINGDWESHSNRWRSCLDIWRHIKYYYPNISIFDVMHVLHSIYHIKTAGQFCTDVERRTFKLLKEGEQPGKINYMKEMYRFTRRSVDEFGLTWEEWKDI